MSDLDYYSPDWETGEPIHVGRWLDEAIKTCWRDKLNKSAAQLAAQLTERLGKKIDVSIDEDRRRLVVAAKRLPRGSVPAEFEDLLVSRG